MMRRVLRLLCLLLVIAFALTGCKAPEPEPEAAEETVATPQPTAAPTERGWVPDPTITPMDFGEYITPDPEKLPPLIHAVDRKPLDFAPYTYVEALGLGYEVPARWEAVPFGTSTVTYYEPDSNIQSKEAVPSSIDVSVSLTGSAATTRDVEDKIDETLKEMAEQGTQYSNLQYSSKAQQRMKNFENTGSYVTFWFDFKPDGQEIAITMRGRIHVVPADRKLILIRYTCPADYNSDYEAVYKQVRDTIREL